MALSRREWFQRTAALGVLPGRALLGLEEYFRPASLPAGVETLVTACGICSSTCGMRAWVKDGALLFLEGLPGDLPGDGKLCGKGGAGAGFLYDPDRLKYPMKRTNPRKGLDEDPGWVRISWSEALDTIASRFSSYLQRYGAESLLFVTLPSPDVWVRFMNSLGVVNRVDHIDECFLTDRVIQRYTTGGKTWCNDFENSRYILLFGFDMLAKSKMAYARTINAARDRGAKIVFFSPVYTATSRFADEWYPIRPGSDLAVALAMISVILEENLYNTEFVSQYSNFPQYEKEIREHFRQYTPEWAEQLSDVPAGVIRRIAREFATQGPAIAPAHKKTLCSNYANASQLTHAISILNILAGTIDRPGGRYFPRTIPIPGVDAIYPPPPYPPKTGRRVDGRDRLSLVHRDDAGLFSTLADGMLNKYPGLIKGAFFNAYTILGFPQPLLMAEALKTVEFTVVMDFLPTDTVTLADIVLPSATYLEVNDVLARDYNARVPQVIARQAVVSPLFEARGLGWVAIELGKRMRPEHFKKPNGDFFTPAELLDEKVRRAGLGDNFADFRRRGIYTREQPFVPRTSFATPSGKCQIYVPEFAAQGYDALPKWRPKREQPNSQYPYYLVTYIPAIHRRNTTQNNRFLNELMPANSVIIHPSLARQLGISEGERVRVRSRVGAIELPAHLSEVLRPDCVMLAHGFGHRSRLLTLAGGRGVRDGDLIAGQSAEQMLAEGNFAGAACMMEAVVTLERLA